MSPEISIEIYKEFPGWEIDGNDVPVFCTQDYADYLKKTKKQQVFWFTGKNNCRTVFIIPFSVTRKAFFNKGTFLTSVINIIECTEIQERIFLENVIQYIKENKICDWIQQSPNWALFRVVPSKSIYCSFGTYRIDLQNNDERDLYKNLNVNTKRVIKKALVNNTVIKRGPDLLNDCLKVFRLAAEAGNNRLPSQKEIVNLFHYLPANIELYLGYYNNFPQSCVIFYLTQFCLYAVYAAVIDSPSIGVNSLLYWTALLDAKQKGIRYFDFVGARVNPVPGSKQEGLKRFKRHLGGEFIKGYLWKIPLSRAKYFLYRTIIRSISFLRIKEVKQDIIDQEIHMT